MRKEEEKKEKEEKTRKNVERKFFGERFSRARVDAHRCAHSNRNVVFLLSQVSHFGGKRRKN